MRGFSSQWLLDIIASHHYPRFYQKGVCLCDKSADKKIWNNTKSSACEGRLFVLSCRCTFGTEQFLRLKVGQTYGKHVLRESVMSVTISAGLCFVSSAPTATHIHLLTASYVKLATLRRAACSLRHSISSFTDTLWETTPLQHGWKMVLMFHLCLTSFFFPG